MSVKSFVESIERICSHLRIGHPITTPTPVTGGLLHRMYRLETLNGVFAVKILNPEIMARDEARANYYASERIAVRISDAGLPAVPALSFEGRFLIQLGAEFFILFPWIEGSTTPAGTVCQGQGEIIATLLGKIHALKLKEPGTSLQPMQTLDWKHCLLEGKKANMPWLILLENNLQNLMRWNQDAIISFDNTVSESLCSHRDMDQKNVLWSDGKPWIIDWEAAGAINPMQELLEMALAWSGLEQGEIDCKAFAAFLANYFREAPRFQTTVSDGMNLAFISHLNWLFYNLKRSMGFECQNKTDQLIGLQESTKCISLLVYLSKFRSHALGIAEKTISKGIASTI